MDRAGYDTVGLVVDGDFNRATGMAGAATLLDAGADAIFCANDAMAAGALETIRARDLRVPDDVALAGFDDLDFSALLDPPLTTVRQGVREQGAEAAHALLQLRERPRRGTAPRDPAHGAGHPAVDGGRCAAPLIGGVAAAGPALLEPIQSRSARERAASPLAQAALGDATVELLSPVEAPGARGAAAIARPLIGLPEREGVGER